MRAFCRCPDIQERTLASFGKGLKLYALVMTLVQVLTGGIAREISFSTFEVMSQHESRISLPPLEEIAVAQLPQFLPSLPFCFQPPSEQTPLPIALASQRRSFQGGMMYESREEVQIPPPQYSVVARAATRRHNMSNLVVGVRKFLMAELRGEVIYAI